MNTTDSRLRAAFAEAERRGLLLTARLRLAILAVLALWLPVENASQSLLFYYPFLVGFALIGLAPLALRRAGCPSTGPSSRWGFRQRDTCSPNQAR